MVKLPKLEGIARGTLLATGLVAGIVTGGLVGIGGVLLESWVDSPKQMSANSQIADFNYDKLPDMVLELNSGRKIPMYGTKKGTEIVYVRASEMIKRNPNSMIDYKSVAEFVNK